MPLNLYALCAHDQGDPSSPCRRGSQDVFIEFLFLPLILTWKLYKLGILPRDIWQKNQLHMEGVKGKPFQRMQLLRFMGGAEEGLMSFPNKYPPERRGQMLSPVRFPSRRLARCSFL